MSDCRAFCPDCGCMSIAYLKESGYNVGREYACGSTRRYRIEVTADWQVVWHEETARGETAACSIIATMRPVFDAAMKPGATHYDPFSQEAHDLREAVEAASDAA